MAKTPETISPAQHEAALARIRKLEHRIEQVVHALAVNLNVSVPDADDEAAE